MKALRYPLSPPSSGSSLSPLRIRTVVSYPGAINRGNALLYLPRLIRDRIYDFSLTTSSQYMNIEIPDTGTFTLPDLCDIDPTFDVEVTQLLFENAIFTLPSVAAIYNFFVWLNEFDDGAGYALATKLELVGMDLFEKDVFTPVGSHLLRRCPNVRELRLLLDFKTLVFTTEDGSLALDMHAMAELYDLQSITAVPGLKRVTIALLPFMALGKKLRDMEAERKKLQELKGPGETGVEGFWGLKSWFEHQCARTGARLEIHVELPEY